MRRTAKLGMMLALALILSYVESLLPLSFGIPGIKLGLPNLIVLLFLYAGDWREALFVNILRIVLSGFLFTNLYAILYALAGAGFSFLAMQAGRRAGCFSMTGVSILGGVFHNIGQCLVAMAVVETFAVVYYLPYLLAAGAVTGAALGIVGMTVLPYLRRLLSQ